MRPHCAPLLSIFLCWTFCLNWILMKYGVQALFVSHRAHGITGRFLTHFYVCRIPLAYQPKRLAKVAYKSVCAPDELGCSHALNMRTRNYFYYFHEASQTIFHSLVCPSSTSTYSFSLYRSPTGGT